MYELPTRPLQFGLGFWPRVRGRSHQQSPKTLQLGHTPERTLSNTDEAVIAVPAPRPSRDNSRPRVSSLQSLTLPASSRSQRFSFPIAKNVDSGGLRSTYE